MKVSLTELTTPKNGYTVLMNRWWCTIDGEPAFYVDRKLWYPQCNPMRGLCEHWTAQGHFNTPPIFVEVAYVRPHPT